MNLKKKSSLGKKGKIKLTLVTIYIKRVIKNSHLEFGL